MFIFGLHLAEIRDFCEIGGSLSRHFLKGSVSKVATTGSSLITVWCNIHRNTAWISPQGS